MAITAAKLQVEVDAETKGLDKGMDRAEGRVSGFGEKLKKSITTIAKWGAAAGAVAIGVGGKVLDLGAQYADMDAKASTVLEGQLGTVQKWAQENAGAMGLTQRELTGLTANFADLLKPMGFTAQQAAEMSTETNELAGALSMWSGGQRSAAEVSEVLASAMLGEREALKGLGISITEADVQARLAAKGQQELTGAAREQAEAVATQELIIAKSTDAQKRWEEGQGSLTVRMNEAKASVQEFKENAVAALLPMVVSLIERGQALVETWGPPIKEWFGKVGPDALEAARSALSAVGDAVEWVRDNSEWLIPVVGGLTTAYVGYLAVTKTVAAATKVWAGVQVILNAVLFANPIGLLVLAIAALAAGLVIAYNTSDTFREKVEQAWEAIKDAAKRLAANVIEGIQLLVDAFLGFAETIIGAAASAFGWVPGLGEKLKGAHENIKEFRKKANDELNQMKTDLRYSADITPAMREIYALREAMRQIPQAATVQFGGTRGGITMHEGGWVPGPSSAEVPAILQGGEFVVSHDMMRRRSAPGGTNYNITVHAPNYVGDKSELGRAVVEALMARSNRGQVSAVLSHGGR